LNFGKLEVKGGGRIGGERPRSPTMSSNKNKGGGYSTPICGNALHYSELDRAQSKEGGLTLL